MCHRNCARNYSNSWARRFPVAAMVREDRDREWTREVKQEWDRTASDLTWSTEPDLKRKATDPFVSRPYQNAHLSISPEER